MNFLPDTIFGNDTFGIGQMVLYLQAILNVIAEFFNKVLSDLIGNATKMGIEGEDLVATAVTTTVSGDVG
ncbi:MAG: hypothetical protein K6C36_06470 [Clostridia bacterium]|nr:hypothetical protein [Clostridia bacterium]